ncbi:uncharacterized protein LAJ45_05396 [Morchella importuna]|uniref:uncharacterized protein n=1 Tax=Morchella importuna TaxID=1174673 RepID=UPI001E8E7D32|nr:uncharacterized protein LAJ45_05396 [Morchella importuna]KAH8150700.1 hypothetical protein LAJ45_05396 [Morchella importuna]
MLFLGLASNLSRRKEEEEAHQPLCETMLRVYCFFLILLIVRTSLLPFPPSLLQAEREAGSPIELSFRKLP